MPRNEWVIISETDFGQVLTVIVGKPYKFKVKGLELGPDSINIYNQFTRAYLFEDVSKHQSNDKTDFEVRIRDEVESKYSREEDLHNAAILFGLLSKKKKPNDIKFDITLGERDSLLSGKRLEGQEISIEILRFYLTVYKKWPGQGIGLPDLQDNFNNDEEELHQWNHHLIQAQSLTRKQGNVTFRTERGFITTSAHIINPMKFHEIKNRFKPMVSAISDIDRYNHYKIIKIDADKLPDGFVFYMTQFDDSNLERFLIIKKFFKKNLNLEIVISKEDNRPNNLNNTIISHIHKCKFAIADVTAQNPNVMYELGFAHAINKEVIMISDKKRKKKKRIFDIDNINTIYFTDIEYLKEQLKNQIQSVLSTLSD